MAVAEEINRSRSDATPQPEFSPLRDAWDTVKWVLKPVASLKLTVVLLTYAVFIVFVGTTAQARKGLWSAVDQYFRSYFCWVELQDLFPPAFIPAWMPVEFPGSFPSLGGWGIGVLMVLNLLAAHLVRFSVQGKGMKLMAGILLILAGAGVTAFLIAFESQNDLGRLLGNLFNDGTPYSIDPSLRILWQLGQAEVAALVLMAGCLFAFQKRAGIVLLHSGVLLLMASELLVGQFAVECQMNLHEGEKINYGIDIRAVELAVIDRANPEVDDTTVIPQSHLVEGATIKSEALPVDIKVLKYYPNSAVRRLEMEGKTPDVNLADQGAGLDWFAEKRDVISGASATKSVDIPSAYVTLTSKNGRKLGTYLLTSVADDGDIIEVGDKKYEIALRFKRFYKPYSVELTDVKADQYLASQVTKNFSSDVIVTDTASGTERPAHIWMNNPLRYNYDTLYQSEYDNKGSVERTGLQIVTNVGWMLPYISCMVVATGLLAQFVGTLWRFLRRREQAGKTASLPQVAAGKGPRGGMPQPKKNEQTSALEDLMAVILPALAVCLCWGFVMWTSYVPSTASKDPNLYEFGRLPVAYDGRLQPIDSLARNTLLVMSDRDRAELKSGKKVPAVKWLLDVAAGDKSLLDYRVFRIDNLELQETLGVKKREGFRYAFSEFSKEGLDKFSKELQSAAATRRVNEEKLSAYQRKVLDLESQFNQIEMLRAAFIGTPGMPTLPDMEAVKADPNAAMAQIQDYRRFTVELRSQLEKAQVPHVALVKKDDGSGDLAWKPLPPELMDMNFSAFANDLVQDEKRRLPIDPMILAWRKILEDYTNKDYIAFNKDVQDYHKLLEKKQSGEVVLAKPNYEARMNHMAPFWVASFFYVFAFVIAAISWLVWPKALGRTATSLIFATWVVHTIFLLARIYISGRPPVTNLYGSAVFIGWAIVVFGLVFERFYRIGIGNAISAVAGFSTLWIAQYLSSEGDTMKVLQAVLDTQFWLSTHVVSITLGYATTYLAGLLAFFYIVLGVFTPKLSESEGKDIGRMIYGATCFAMFFSFVGTVLGGLWADDSWGRFWGWDPKENGALMIVLWNAIMLHAKWGGMIKERGLAVLAVLGNIVVSWSWFGVNQMGVGLHSYGFTEGVVLTLFFFAITQLALAGVGLMPKAWWWSFSRPQHPAVPFNT